MFYASDIDFTGEIVVFRYLVHDQDTTFYHCRG